MRYGAHLQLFNLHQVARKKWLALLQDGDFAMPAPGEEKSVRERRAREFISMPLLPCAAH